VVDEPVADGPALKENGRIHGVTEVARQADERTTLMGFLQRQRDLVAWKCGEASDDVLRSEGTPSGMTLHGIVRHLENVERSWFRDVFAGEEELSFDWTEKDPIAEFNVPADVPMADLLAAYAEEAGRCDVVVESSLSLDEIAERGDVSLRWIILHLIEETARHVGHIDLLRERADGMVGEDPFGEPA
jgi:uncharacterized damage-inducible protein DinB